MSLYEQIVSEMKQAMKNQDKETLSTIRLLKSAIDLYRINNKITEITDEVVIEVTAKQVKTHKDSIEEFVKAGREDLSSRLEEEIKVLKRYLPEELSKEEIIKKIDEAISKVNPTSKNDMGKIMKELSSLKGRCDMKFVNSIVIEKLS